MLSNNFKSVLLSILVPPVSTCHVTITDVGRFGNQMMEYAILYMLNKGRFKGMVCMSQVDTVDQINFAFILQLKSLP